MALLEDILPELTIKKKRMVGEQIENHKKLVKGVKRRAWLNQTAEDFCENQTKEAMDKKGAINPFDKPHSIGFYELRGNPRQMFIYLHSKNQGINVYETGRVKLREMALALNISRESARTAMRFLLKQQLISRVDFKVGQMGWSRYQLQKKACEDLEEALHLKSKECSRALQKFDSDEDSWDGIDIAPLQSIGFNRNHLLQLKNKNTPEIVQESINHFAFALTNKKLNQYKDPLATIIAVLKRGEAWIESNYKSPLELSREKYLEIKKEELNRQIKLKEEIYELAFMEWRQNTDKMGLFEAENYIKDALIPIKAKLRLYFKDKIWPNHKDFAGD
ncbi:hypothetical protein [Fluoribacter gormanii]|uniref:hypothetical protein n=1 Tax=Fluoribacter gormanii TaxID=464 RepID=UPI00104171E2|nr:hypothetical protein [Fluoribacter gormanii]